MQLQRKSSSLTSKYCAGSRQLVLWMSDRETWRNDWMRRGADCLRRTQEGKSPSGQRGRTCGKFLWQRSHSPFSNWGKATPGPEKAVRHEVSRGHSCDGKIRQWGKLSGKDTDLVWVERHLRTCESDSHLARCLLSARAGRKLLLPCRAWTHPCGGLSLEESEFVALWLEEPTLAVVSFSDQDSCGRNWSMTLSEAQGFALFLQRPVNFAS